MDSYRDAVAQGNALEGIRLGDGVLDQGLVARHVPRRATVALGRPARVPDGPALFHLVAAIPLSSIHRRRLPRAKVPQQRRRRRRSVVVVVLVPVVYRRLSRSLSRDLRSPPFSYAK